MSGLFWEHAYQGADGNKNSARCFRSIGLTDRYAEHRHTDRPVAVLGLGRVGARRPRPRPTAYPLGRPAYPLKIAAYPERK